MACTAPSAALQPSSACMSMRVSAMVAAMAGAARQAAIARRMAARAPSMTASVRLPTSLVGSPVRATGEQDRRQHRQAQRKRQQPRRAVGLVDALRHVAGHDRACPVTGTIWFFTLGLLGIGWLIDLFLIPSMDPQADVRFQNARQLFGALDPAHLPGPIRRAPHVNGQIVHRHPVPADRRLGRAGLPARLRDTEQPGRPAEPPARMTFRPHAESSLASGIHRLFSELAVI